MKDRRAAKEFTENPVQYYFEIYAAVSKYKPIRFVSALAVHMGWIRMTLDVKTAFLNAPQQEEVYIQQPEVFFIQGKESMFFKLKEALYGLKQAFRQ